MITNIYKATYYNLNTVKILCVFFLVLFSNFANAQQEPMYGQYIFNSSIINPAQAGASKNDQWGALARNQWVGIDGAPRTESIYANLSLSKHVGLAFGIYQDRLGPEQNLNFQADISYHARLSENWYLASGLRFMGSNFRINFSDIPNVENGDPYLNRDVSSGLLFNVGAGLLAYNKRTFFGVALPRAFNSQIHLAGSQSGNNQESQIGQKSIRDLFAYAGTNIELTDEITFIPSTLFKYPVDAPVQMDLNVVFGFNDVLDFGPVFRTNLIEMNDWFDAAGFVVNIRFLSNWHFGYMYEYPLTDLNLATKQTHEISIRFSLGSEKKERIASPRYFLY